MKELPPPIPLLVNGVSPAFVDKKTAAIYVGSPTLVERMLWATRHTDDKWVVIAMNQEGDPKQKTLIDAASLEAAAVRINRGERPPRIGKVQLLQLKGDSFFDPNDTMESEVSRAFPDSFNPDVEEERALGAASQEEQKKREEEALQAEKAKLEKKVTELHQDEEMKVEIDPKLIL